MSSIYIRLHNGQMHQCASLDQAKRLIKAGSGEYINGSERRTFSNSTKIYLLKLQDNICPLCLNALYPYDAIDVDHIHPYSKASSYKNGPEHINELDNLQVVHQRCNRIKRDKLEADQ